VGLSKMRISIFGLGKVGLTLASCLSVAGHDVLGADVDPDLVKDLNQGTFRTSEPGVRERFARKLGSFRATTNDVEAVCDTDVTFVVVPTPSNSLGGFSLRSVVNACEGIGTALKAKSREHTVAIVSTMLPGSSNAVVIPSLERASHRQIGEGLNYCYNPSFIALGEVVNGIENPDYLLVGEANSASGDIVLSVHRTIIRNGSPIARMTPVEAEIAKIASNTHETMRVSFANMLLSVCSEVPGASVDRITGALAHRMGRRFFKGAAPYGGPCWPRDNEAFSVFMDAIHAPSALPRAVHTFNEQHGQYVLRKILSLSHVGDTVGILGLAYKLGTPVIEASFAIDLARWLIREGRSVVGWDPLAMHEARRVLGDAISYAETCQACLKLSDLAVIVNPIHDLDALDWSTAREITVVDCWRCLSPETVAQIAVYVPLGVGPNCDVAGWLKRVVGSSFELLTN
jgi:UDPglucose 6-dehydrogenase